MSLRQRTEDRLKAINQTKSWLADELHVERQNLNNWLNRNKIPEGYIFVAARLLECDAEWLATGKESTPLDFGIAEIPARYDIDTALEREIRKLSTADTQKVASFIEGLKAGRKQTGTK